MDKVFCHLHTHTAQGSLLDSILTVDEMVKFAKDNGMKAMALTDHGTMTSFVNFVKGCNKNGVKPIIGNEIYEVDDMWQKSDTKEYSQPRYHLILLARTQQGFHNLLKITSISRTEGLYKKPRIDLKYIKENNLGNGIICLTACQAGRLSRYLLENKVEEAKGFIDNLQSIFDYVVCELQAHDTKEQAYANFMIYDFCVRNKLPYTITTDAHMLSDSLQDSHSMFVEIGEGREVGESYQGCYLQTEDEIYNTLSNQFSRGIIKTGIEESNKIADMVEEIDIGLNRGNVMPKINIEGNFESHEEYLRYLVFQTFDEKFGHMSKEEQEIRRQRLETELPVLNAVEYTDYFIMLYMLAKEARKRKIPLGYSRGSGANCLCLFMLNVTQIDSVRWDLDFSRFANLGRKSLADFDWDISKRRRKEMVEISEELFGKENVAPIATFNTLSTKVAIRDIGKVLNEKEDSPYYKMIPYTMRDEVAKMIPTIKTLNDLGEEEEKDVLLKDILSKNEKLKAIYEQFPLWFKYVMDVEGLPKSMGRHAAGTLITPTPITDYCALCYDSEKNIMIELEMHNAMDDLKLVKMDYLGLETLDIIDDTLKMAGLTWEDVDINHLDLEDKEVFEQVYKTGNTVGIFQMESAEARKMCIEAKADNVEDIIVVNAANRPGTKENFPIYCNNKLHPEKTQVVHDDLRTIFGKTHCVLLYQEQALQLFRHADFPESEVDNARRCIDENTLVTMGNGDIKRIKDICVGDSVLCLDENTKQFTSKRVLNVFDNNIQYTYILKTTKGYELIATKDHKVLTQAGWKCVKDLTPLDSIITECEPIKIKEITECGERHVYDLEVEDHHNYIANNLIVHNCIGKKDKKKMADLEVNLRSGLLSKGWNNEQLIAIWQLLKKQAEYSFNRGHAVAYGLLSYLTGYLKTHYTIYFMAALLSSKSDKAQKISIVINDCKRLGITVAPPNVNKSNREFTPIPEENKILFGLLAIKGLGESVVTKMIDMRPYKNFDDFVERVSDKTAIITSIKAGAIPTKNKMRSLQKYADSLFDKKEFQPVTTVPSPYSKLIPFGLNVKDYREGRKVDKERLLMDYNRVKEARYKEEQEKKYKIHMKEFQDKYAQDEYMWEFDTLSMFLTNDPLKDAYKHTKTDWDMVPDGDKTILFCVIVDIKRKKDKNGNPYVYLDLYTPYGIIEATAWSRQLKEYSEMIKKGNCLAILGRKREEHFFVEKIKTYNMWLEQMKQREVTA